MAARLRAEVRQALSNLLLKAFSLPLEKVCRTVLILVSGRALGLAALGRYKYAGTLTGMLALGTDLGLCIWTTRTLARSRAGAAAVIGTGLRVRALAAVPYAVLAGAAAAAVGPGETRWAILLLGLSALTGAFVDHFAAIF